MGYKTGWMKKIINNVSTKVFAYAHVKTVFKDYSNGITLDDVLIETEDFDQTAVTESDISPVILSKLNSLQSTQSDNFTLLNKNKAEAAQTYTKSEVDNAIDKINNAKQNVTDNTLETTAKTIPAAINEVHDEVANAQNTSDNHIADKNNPHGVTKAQVGLGNVDNTADINKPVSTAQQDAIDAAYANSNYYTDQKIADLINGAPTTLDTLKEIADAMAEQESVVEALDEAIGSKANESEFNSHVANKSNPHGVTKSQVGLGNVDNTSDANKPVSTAQATAIADAKKAGTDARTTIDNHISNKSNPHGVTKSQVGLSNVPNVATNDQTPTYTFASSNTELTSGEKLSVAMGKIAKAVSSLISHLSNKSNPHGVTKSQVGLGNVPNTDFTNNINSITNRVTNLEGTTLTGILTAGQTELIFVDSAIIKDSTIDLYTEIYGVNPKTVEVTSGKITMTFKAQSTDVKVKVVIK